LEGKEAMDAMSQSAVALRRTGDAGDAE
jgi:hypothetical protein